MIEKLTMAVYNHKRRSFGMLTEEDIQFSLEFFDGKCPYSDTILDDNNWHLDHIIPVDLGGETEVWNCMPVCGPCNLSKSNKHLLDWWNLEHTREEEYKLEKIFNYIVEALSKPRKVGISTEENSFADKKLTTWMFLSQILSHMNENREFIKGDIAEYGKIVSKLFTENLEYENNNVSFYAKQNELLYLFKKLNIRLHYAASFILFPYVKDIDVCEKQLMELSEFLPSIGLTLDSFAYTDPKMLLLSANEVKVNYNKLINQFQIPEKTILAAPWLIRDVDKLDQLYKFLESAESIVKPHNIYKSIFYRRSIEEVKEIVDIINEKHKGSALMSFLPSKVIVKSYEDRIKGLNKWIDEQNEIYDKYSALFDAYLKATTRTGTRKTQKIVIKDKTEYSSEEEYKEQILLCLFDIANEELFEGIAIGKIMGDVRTGKRQTEIKFLNSYYGIDVAKEFDKIRTKNIENRPMEMIEFWDAYLHATCRENKDKPKIVVKNREDYESEELFKRDVVRCLLGIMSKEETFRGIHIGNILQNAIIGQSKEVLSFWNKYYGIDFVRDSKKEIESIVVEFWDAYLHAEKRENKKSPKVIVKSREEYEMEEEYKSDVIKCFAGIIQNGEEFNGKKIGTILNSFKQNQRQGELQVINNYYGIDLLQGITQIDSKKKDNVNKFWQQYLKAEKRENKEVPKVVVKNLEEYKNPEDYKKDVMRCFAGIVQNGETFHGVNIGNVLKSIKTGQDTRTIKFFKETFGVDLLKAIDFVEKERVDAIITYLESYLSATERDNGDKKIVVKRKEDYKNEQNYLDAIVKCVRSIRQDEMFKGKNIGTIFSNAKRRYKDVLKHNLTHENKKEESEIITIMRNRYGINIFQDIYDEIMQEETLSV